MVQDGVLDLTQSENNQLSSIFYQFVSGLKAWKRQRIVNLTKNEEDKHIRAFKTK